MCFSLQNRHWIISPTYKSSILCTAKQLDLPWKRNICYYHFSSILFSDVLTTSCLISPRLVSICKKRRNYINNPNPLTSALSRYQVTGAQIVNFCCSNQHNLVFTTSSHLSKFFVQLTQQLRLRLVVSFYPVQKIWITLMKLDCNASASGILWLRPRVSKLNLEKHKHILHRSTFSMQI